MQSSKTMFRAILAFALAAAVSAAPHVNYTVGDGCTVTSYSQVASAVSSCTTLIINGITVPAKTTLTLNLKDSAKVTFEGHIKFEYAAWSGPLVLISGKNIFVQQASGSYLDGLGPSYWDGKGDWGTTKPKFFYIEKVTGGSEFRNIYLKNCPAQCTAIGDSDSLTLDGWVIDNRAGDTGTAASGKEGHNTDGFDISKVTNLVVENANVYNQDDCVAINVGSNLKFTNMYCHGSHGLSLAVGESTTDGTTNRVSDVVFANSSVVDGMVGIHIKTMPSGAAGYVKNIYYQNIQMSGISDYAISVQEDYSGGSGTGTPSGNIPITNLQLSNVKATMNGQYSVPVYILCGTNGCSDWKWSQVSVTGGKSASKCNFTPSGYTC